MSQLPPTQLPPYEDYKYVIGYLKNQMTELKKSQNKPSLFSKILTALIGICLVFFLACVLLNLTQRTSILFPSIAFGGGKGKSSSILHIDTFPLYKDISVGLVAGFAMLYGAILAFLFSLYKQRQLQQQLQLFSTQFQLMDRYYKSVSWQHQRLRDAAKNITIPYSLDALLEKNLDDFPTSSAQYQAIPQPVQHTAAAQPMHVDVLPQEQVQIGRKK